MYSRRLLIDNYSKFYNIPKNNPLKIMNNQKEFLLYENDYGTMFYHVPLFNGLELMNLEAKYYFINSAFLNSDDIQKLLANKYEGSYDRGFLDTETIYKLKEDNSD